MAKGGGKWKETQALGVLRRGARVAAVPALRPFRARLALRTTEVLLLKNLSVA